MLVVALMLRVGSVGFVLPGGSREKTAFRMDLSPSGIATTPSWDCGAELSQTTFIPFPYQAQVLVSNVEHNDLFQKTLAHLKSSCPHSTSRIPEYLKNF